MLLDHHDGGDVALPHTFITPPTDSFMTTLTCTDDPVLADGTTAMGLCGGNAICAAIWIEERMRARAILSYVLGNRSRASRSGSSSRW